MYRNYVKAMRQFDANFESLSAYYRSLLKAIKCEVLEFILEPSLDEFSDIIHGIARLLKGFYLLHFIVGGKAPRKLTNRFLQYGTIRSSRNIGKLD